jgi:hypothetical protein
MEKPLSPEQFFEGDEAGMRLFEAVRQAVDACGPSDINVSKSQIAFRRKKGFAWAWRPGMYLRGKRPPLVLTIGLHRRDPSPRWKQVVEPYPGRFIHHLELYSERDLDEEMQAVLAEAWALAR